MEVNIAWIVVSFFIGSGLGLFYFGGLWWVLNRFAEEKASQALVLISLFLRNALVFGGFVLIAVINGSLPNILSALAGFVLIKLVMIRSKKKPGPAESAAKTDTAAASNAMAKKEGRA